MNGLVRFILVAILTAAIPGVAQAALVSFASLPATVPAAPANKAAYGVVESMEAGGYSIGGFVQLPPKASGGLAIAVLTSFNSNGAGANFSFTVNSAAISALKDAQAKRGPYPSVTAHVVVWTYNATTKLWVTAADCSLSGTSVAFVPSQMHNATDMYPVTVQVPGTCTFTPSAL